MLNNKKVILHVARLADLPQSGVAVVVPGYIKEQSKYANVALLNIRDFIPKELANEQVFLHSKLSDGLRTLKPPFDHPDLIVFHEVYWPEFLKIAKYCISNSIPYIITPHVSLTETAQKNKYLKKLFGNLFFFNIFIRNARAIHFLSESEKQQTNKYTSISSFICGNGISTRPRVKKVFNQDSLELIYVGRFDFKIKGIDRILYAANAIKQQMRDRNITIHLYGTHQEGSQERMQDFISEYKIDDIVRINDGLFGEEKVKRIIRSDCFIQLSRTEGQPLGIMEAMDIGMPCIVTEGTTFHAIAKKHRAGIPVSDDPNEIAQAILSVRKGKYDLESISKHASEYIKSHFDWSVVGKNMISDYLKVIDRFHQEQS